MFARINCQLDLWDRGIYAGLVGVALKEVRSRKGRVDRSKEEEEDFLGRSFHSTLMSGKLWQAVRQATDWETGGGCLLFEDVCTKTGRLIADVIHEKHPNMHILTAENRTCSDFEE